MGISGLHQQLKPAQRKINVEELRGKTLALDGHVLLHRGAMACAEQLAEGKQTTRYTNYAVTRVQLLAAKGVKAIVVFDGAASMPLKTHTNTGRRTARDDALKAARSAKRECERAHAANEPRDVAMDAMHKAYRATVRITSTMVEVTKREIEKLGIRCLVAPYEADAQLAALCCLGLADGVVTEDSDLAALLCGLRLHRCLLVTKLDREGQCDLLIPGDLTQTLAVLKRSKFGKALAKVRDERTGARCFVQTCVLAGCDYYASEQGVGVVKAAEHVAAARRLSDDERLGKAIKGLADVAGAKAAERAFYHAKVWKGLPGHTSLPRCIALSELVCPVRVSVPPAGDAIDEEVGPSLRFVDCEAARVVAAFPPARHSVAAAFAKSATKPRLAAPAPATAQLFPAAEAAPASEPSPAGPPPAPPPPPPAPPPLEVGIDGSQVDLETLQELPPDIREDVERQLMLWRATRRGAARSPPPLTDAPAPKPRARSSSSRASGARPRSSSSAPAAKPAKKTARRKTAPEPLKPANAADVQSFFAPKPGAAKRPRWRSLT